MRLAQILFAGLLASSTQAFASGAATVDLYSAAKISFPTLAVPVGVRAIAMGEAYTAAGNDVYALNWNPAGLAKVGGFDLGLAHNEWSSELGMRQEFLTYGQSLSSKSGMGVSFNYFSLGNLDQRDDTGALSGQSAAYAFSGNAGYGWSMLGGDQLRLGLALEFGMQSLFGASQSGFGGSLGLLYDLTREYSLGLSVNHLGTGTGGFAPPESVNLGVSGLFLNKNLTLALDGAMPFSSDPEVKAGLEFNLGVLALRGGYRYAIGAKPGDVQSGFSAGAGFKAGVFSIDYAFVPYGELSSTHRVAATIQLPDDFFKPQVIGAEATTTTAKSFYNKAVAFEKGGDTLMALVQYQRCEESYPEKLRSTPQEFYGKAKQKIKELQAELNKKGDNGQVVKYRQKFIDKAQEYLAAKHYKEAIAELQQAKAVDSSTTPPIVDKLLKDARHGMEERLSGYRNEARAADKEGKLPVAIDNYERLLGVDETDSEAQAFFSNKRLEIQNYLKKAHRMGIDLYVSGKVDEAVKIWIKGRALDHFHDVDFTRDIDKAKKLLDLRGQK